MLLCLTAPSAHALTYCQQSGIDRAVSLSHAQVRLTSLGFQNTDLSSLPDDVPQCREVSEAEHRTNKGAITLDVEYRREPAGGRVGRDEAALRALARCVTQPLGFLTC